MSEFIPAAKVGEVVDPGSLLVEIDDRLVVLIHAAGHWYALDVVCTLDHSVLRVDDPALRAFLGGLDGSRDAGGLEALATESRFAEPAQWRAALDIALRKALIMPAA